MFVTLVRIGFNDAGFLDVVFHGGLLSAGFQLCPCMPEVEVVR
jgi:hypothetical protein